MELRPVFLLLIDISGYTRFTTAHRTAVMHAERIISDLLEGVIQRSRYPLIVHEVLGDAVSLYVDSAARADVADEIRRQIVEILAAFRRQEAELVSECSLCSCDACRNVGRLQLKAVLHHGQAVFTTLRGFHKLAGEDVILAHRLLKNSVPSSEYILETEAFSRLGGGFPGFPSEERTEAYPGLGAVRVRVVYPFSDAPGLPPRRSPLWRKLMRLLKHDIYSLRRRLGSPAAEYRNLDAAPEGPGPSTTDHPDD